MSEQREPTPDEAMGMAWWNSLSERQRLFWLDQAGTAVPADAYAAFKADQAKPVAERHAND